MHLVNKYIQYIFIVLLVVSIQLSPHMVIDNLIYRAVLISVVTFIWILIWLFNKGTVLYYNKYDLFGGLLVLYYCAGLFWSNTYTLAILSISKLLVFYILFRLLNFSIYQNGDLKKVLIKGIIIAFIFSFVTFIKQFIGLDEFNYFSFYSLSGISGHKNLYSSFVFLTLIGSFIGLKYLREQKGWFVIVVCTICLQVLTILVLRARAVWLAVAVSAFVYLFLSFFKSITISLKRVWIYSITGAVIGTLFFLFILPAVLNWYLGQQHQTEDITEITNMGTFSERVKVWSKTYELIDDNTLWGVGNGNWKINISKYSLPEIYKVQDLNVIFQRPHNEYLKIFSENGIIGLFIFLFSLYFLILSLFNPNTQISQVTNRYLISGFLGFFTIMFFSFPLERTEHCLILTFLLSIAHSSIRNNKEENKLNISKRLLFIPLLLCLLVLGVFYSRYKSSYYIRKMYYERNQGNNEKVLALCDSAITSLTKVDDFSIPIHWYRGNANANLRNYKIALQDFKYAKEYNPYNANVLNDLGSAYVMNSKIDSALCFYEEATKINPRFDDAKLNLVSIYLNQGNIEMAKKWEDEIFHDSDRRSYYKDLIRQIESSGLLE